ncbi:MAG: Lar family restriction alleviation protein [Coriobacteriales bacterium]|nr:Lar family restriction alleviation protein [Coriobacteriales bacterium]
MEKLIPCPFCGGVASIKINDFFDGTPDGTRLYTPKCKCGAGIVEVFRTEAEAVKAWNTRYERTCHFKPFKGETERGVCSVCSALMYESNCYCPNCGAKVVEK